MSKSLEVSGNVTEIGSKLASTQSMKPMDCGFTQTAALLGMIFQPSLSFFPYFPFLPNFSGLQVAVGLPFLLILLSLCLMPLGIYSPCIQEKENLGPKPILFGHRGAPMVGLSMKKMDENKYVWDMWSREEN